MTSTRELALQALFYTLKDALPDITVLRNSVLTTAVPDSGLIIVRDGEVGEPDMLLSPPRYIYKHKAECDVIIQHQDDLLREQQFDALLINVGDILQQTNTLNGLIDLLTVGSPELVTEPIEGAATMKAATVPVILEYVTDHPLL